MKDFKQIFDDSIVRLNANMSFTPQSQFDFINKGIDIEKELKHQMSLQLSKDLMDNKNNKIDFIKIEDDYKSKLYTELFVCSRQKLFDVFHSFNELPEQTRRSFIKWLAPDEEEYINQVRQDNLNKIFPPSPNNI